ncbi:MAG: lipoyl synthase [Arcanobacterium sp.]|nr:lipoyl synthase [Arcanobacterium sp.]MDY5589200.1 lipoyl synthase [Arcanobacterium sp.]
MAQRVDPEARKLLRVEERNREVPIEKQRPEWLKTRAVVGPEYAKMRELNRGSSLHTICEEGNCPNIYECWDSREASFLLGGDICTRRCDFCFVKTGRPTSYDTDEPRRLAERIAAMQLTYATITGVTRDDLDDGASWLYAETCRLIHELSPTTGVELLIDDMRGGAAALSAVFEAHPEVLAHNLETVPRIFKQIRPAFRYERSLGVIRSAHEAGLITKSNFILGMGETSEEVLSAMHDLREAGCDILTITQYLRPSPLHHPISRWVKPQEFVELRNAGLAMGFAAVMAGPLVRSSYHGGTLWARAMAAKGIPIPEHLRGVGDGTAVARQEASAVLERLGS